MAHEMHLPPFGPRKRIMRIIAANAGQGQEIGWRIFYCGAWIFNRKPSRFNRGGLLFFISSPQVKINDLSFHRKTPL